MVNIKTLLPELKALVTELAEDMLARVTADSQADGKLKAAFQQIKEGGRTAQIYEEWREDYLDQVAVAWVLACVFVRFMEDNDLINECWLAGEGDRRKLAEGAYELFFRQHPHDTDREYLKHVFIEIRKIPAATELFAEGKTSLWAVDPSGDVARRLVEYFREIDAENGGLKRSFATTKVTTQPLVDVYQNLAPQARFLGDLYQDLSEHARKKYALLQTPEFVEQFILDRTLTYALDEFGLKDLRLIDATCGSGHFLLGAFDRLFREWMKPERGVNNPVVAAQNALDSIFGVDINSFAIAITRFRLFIAVVNACGISKLNQQIYAWKFNLATGDSLLWGSKPTFNNERVPISHQHSLFEVDPIFAVEDPVALREILGQGYHVAVGNPPYIIVRDRAQNAVYRQLYSTCHQKYSLGVPFTQRFWELALRKGERIKENAEAVSSGAGYIGMITANSFMKREFGKKLIEEFFPKIDLTQVIDTSSAYIPGHGTPTVILFGRARKPVGDTVRAVLGIKGEPTTPEDASQGLVWNSILRHIDISGAQDDFTSTLDVLRTNFTTHPWSIGGGGATELKEMIEESSQTQLGSLVASIGVMAVISDDEAFVSDRQTNLRHGILLKYQIEVVGGDSLRDWILSGTSTAIFPYSEDDIRPVYNQQILRRLWPLRAGLRKRMMFGQTQTQRGLDWYAYAMLIADKFRVPMAIPFAEVATHNHFVLDQGCKVFKQSAPVIKLRKGSTLEDHLSILGPLNSSTVCFWTKQVFQTKGSSGIGRGIYDEAWEKFYQLAATGLHRLPLPDQYPLATTRKLHHLGDDYCSILPDRMDRLSELADEQMSQVRTQAASIRAQMIALQEELDWECYRHYGLLTDDLRYPGDDLPELKLGERAFEIVMARQMVQGELQTAWFERHGSAPLTEIPTHWPTAYRTLVERRIKLIETNKEIGLIEKPEYKRRWNTEPWAEQVQAALRTWLLDRLESFSHGSTPEWTTGARLADKASSDAEFMQVAALYRDRSDFDVAALVAELVESASVPFLPILRYKLSGLRKRELWERTWELQRKEDAGEKVGEIPVPPKYASADFQKTDYWRMRGKLDVPKERWISYPHCQTDSDPSLVVCWAGWNHLQQAEALVASYDARKREAWDAKRLTPLLAGLDQLLPWIHQWHPEIDPEFGETAGKSFQTMLEHDAHELGLTLDDIRNWQPPVKSKKTRKKREPEDDE